jgi:hypothetical protein
MFSEPMETSVCWQDTFLDVNTDIIFVVEQAGQGISLSDTIFYV